MLKLSWAVPAVAFVISFCSSVFADTITVDSGFDRWMYPFSATPGTRATGSVFGAIGSDGFDNRDAQVVIGFDVSAVSSPAADQRLTAVVLRITTAGDESFVYDPTYDLIESYTSDTDSDAGRPLELFGVGTRNGITGLTLDDASTDPLLFKESSPFSTVPGSFLSSRSVFAADAAGEDVSNSVSQGLELSPWAIGMSTDLAAGSKVPINTEFSFAIDLADSANASYVDAGLATGELFFSISSLHGASQDGPPSFPSFYLDANGASLGQIAQLDFEYSQVPEPRAHTLVGLAMGSLLAFRRRIRN